MSPPFQVKFASEIVALAKSLYSQPGELQQLYAACVIVNDCIGDDATIMQELLDYLAASIDVAKGQEDPAWRDELLETLEEDLSDED